MVWHGWMIEAMKVVGIRDNMMNLFENSKEAWRAELTACNESLEEVDIRREIFQGGLFFTFGFSCSSYTLYLYQ